MNKIGVLAHKELASYFKSPVATIVLVVTISVFNIFFFMGVTESKEASLRDVFRVMEFMFVFIVPLLTMKVFSEEKSTGTMEFLMTTPTTNTAIVLGKYLGSLIFFTLIIVLTTPYYLIIEYFGHPDRLAILTGYAGIWLEGALFVAIGMLMSSRTRNQIIAAISSYAILFLLFFSVSFVQYFNGLAKSLVRYGCVLTHSENFFMGLITTADLVYFLSGIFICILLTRLSIENRLWR